MGGWEGETRIPKYCHQNSYIKSLRVLCNRFDTTRCCRKLSRKQINHNTLRLHQARSVTGRGNGVPGCWGGGNTPLRGGSRSPRGGNGTAACGPPKRSDLPLQGGKPSRVSPSPQRGAFSFRVAQDPAAKVKLHLSFRASRGRVKRKQHTKKTTEDVFLKSHSWSKNIGGTSGHLGVFKRHCVKSEVWPAVRQ